MLSQIRLHFMKFPSLVLVSVGVFRELPIEVVKGAKGQAADADDGPFLVIHNYS